MIRNRALLWVQEAIWLGVYNMKRISILLFVSLMSLLVVSCKKDQVFTYRRHQLGTVVNLTIISSKKKADMAAQKAFDEIERIENLMSPYRDKSDVFRINRDAAVKSVLVSSETFSLLQRSNKIAIMTKGSFDITWAPLGKIWNYKRTMDSFPSKHQVVGELRKVGYEKLGLHPGTSKVSFFIPGMKIGLGGIAKGYAVSQAGKVLLEEDVTSFIVEEGGDLQVYGTKMGQKWRTGIMYPGEKKLIAILEMDSGDSIATSGNYERFIEYKGKKYSHILDPRTGYPADTGLLSVSVISKDPVLSDALATAITVMGKTDVDLVMELFPGISVILVDDNFQVFASPMLKGKLFLSDKKRSVHWIVDSLFRGQSPK
jgi:FAD:protein FMN transferase